MKRMIMLKIISIAVFIWAVTIDWRAAWLVFAAWFIDNISDSWKENESNE